MYHEKYLHKYQYAITIECIQFLNRMIAGVHHEKAFTICIEKEYARDLKFLLHVKYRLFIKQERQKAKKIIFEVITPDECSSFRVLKDITPENHPWIGICLPAGSMLRGTSAPTYGVVNWMDGIALEIEGVSHQVNRTHIEVVDMS